MCQVNDGIGDTEHFLLLCNSFQEQRHTLLAGVNDVLAAYEYSVSSNSDMLEILLYGSKQYSWHNLAICYNPFANCKKCNNNNNNKHLSLEANNLILKVNH